MLTHQCRWHMPHVFLFISARFNCFSLSIFIHITPTTSSRFEWVITQYESKLNKSVRMFVVHLWVLCIFSLDSVRFIVVVRCLPLSLSLSLSLFFFFLVWNGKTYNMRHPMRVWARTRIQTEANLKCDPIWGSNPSFSIFPSLCILLEMSPWVKFEAQSQCTDANIATQCVFSVERGLQQNGTICTSQTQPNIMASVYHFLFHSLTHSFTHLPNSLP